MEIEQQTPPEWRNIAFENGYYDHAHFVHDFRHFAGMTPTQYLTMKNGQVNYVPVG
jgi:AraC-like DNA-binding protein